MGFWAAFPYVASAATNLASSLLGKGQEGLSETDQKYVAHFQMQQAMRNEEFQNKLATHGIRMKVADAEAAGLHPLAALGATTPTGGFGGSFQINPRAPSNRTANALSGLGQDISRAAMATQTRDEREMAALAKTRANLENSILQQQLISATANNNRSVGPALPSNSDMPLLTGQGNAFPTRSSSYVTETPLMRVHSQPGRPAQEVGAISDYGYARTPKGYSVVPSKDIKERIEDQFIPEIMWSIRNQLMPTISRIKSDAMAPDPRYYPLPKGYDKWHFHPFSQEYRPANSKNVPWYKRKGAYLMQPKERY